jgi:hypothetical protein
MYTDRTDRTDKSGLESGANYIVRVFSVTPCLRGEKQLLHGDHDHRRIVLEALLAVLAYGLHQAALDFLG